MKMTEYLRTYPGQKVDIYSFKKQKQWAKNVVPVDWRSEERPEEGRCQVVLILQHGNEIEVDSRYRIELTEEQKELNREVRLARMKANKVKWFVSLDYDEMKRLQDYFYGNPLS